MSLTAVNQLHSCASLYTVYFCILETEVLLPEITNVLGLPVSFITLVID